MIAGGQGAAMRLQVRMARAGVASRRECERLIRDGRVAVNGERTTAMGVKVSDADTVAVDGRELAAPTATGRYLALNKPPGYLCANRGGHGRPLALELLPAPPEAPRLFHVGRLDLWSQGLILYTSDGDFALRASHPRYTVEKEYVVVADRIDVAHLQRHTGPAPPEGLALASFEALGDRRARVTLTEGRNREVRRIFAGGQMRVRTLERQRIGPVRLGRLASGHWRDLSEEEVQWFLGRSAAAAPAGVR